MISFLNVHKSYLHGSVTVFDDLNLSIQSGELAVLVGQSGCGKSTLLSMLIGEEYPDSGEVKIDGIMISSLTTSELQYMRRRIGMVFQDYKLLETKTVFENVAFALEVTGVSGEIAQDTVASVLQIVGLSEKGDRFPKELSGGEQQRVAIARALVHSPKLFIADEPTGNLDLQNTKEIVKLLKKINKMGVTVLVVTHDRDMIEHLHGRAIEIKDGKAFD